MPLLVIFALAIALGAIVFAFQNANAVTINLIVWHFEESLAIVLLVTLSLGVIIGLLLSIPALVKRGWKSSGQKKQITNLESRLYEQSRTISREKRDYESLSKSNQELLKALSLNDPLTDLLSTASLEQVMDYQLQKMREADEDDKYNSVCVLYLYFEPVKAEASTSGQVFENYLIKSCAETLKDHVIPRSLLYYDGRKGFICLTPGLSSQKASEYGEFLTNLFQEFPIKKSDDSIIALKTSGGGVIAYPTDTINSRSLLQKAKQTQEQVRQKSRNRFLLVPVTD